MKRRSFLRNSILGTAGIAVSPWILAENSLASILNKGSKTAAPSANKITVVELSGIPRQRGQIYGESVRGKIQDFIKIWKDDIGKSEKANPDKYIKEFLQKTNFQKAIKTWNPGLLDEVKGISEASGVDYDSIYAFQLLDETWWYALHHALDIPLLDPNRCSALGAFNQEGLPSYVAQTLDLGDVWDGFQVLLHIKEKDSPVESFILSISGLVAGVGMNNQAVGVCCNTVIHLDHSVDGLPVMFVVRGILEKTKYADAVKFIHSVKHASGQNYTIGGLEEVAAFECSATKVSRFVPYEGANRVYHTNHPLVNDDQAMWKEIMKKLPQEASIRPKLSDSEVRFQALERRLRDPQKKVTIDTIKAALGSHDNPDNPVCKHKASGTGCSVGTVIYELKKPPVLHLTIGPPCKNDFQVYKF